MSDPKEIETKATDLLAKLQEMSRKKIGYGMDAIFREVLQAAYDLVELVRDLARLHQK